MKRLAVILPIILASCGSEPTSSTQDRNAPETVEPELTCDMVAEEVVNMSQEEEVSILKIYDITEMSKTDELLTCEGNAMLSIGDERQEVYFKHETDEDGDQFVGYSTEPYTK